MEMPVDILTYRLGKMVDNGVNIPDPSAAAVSIDEDLQANFISIPIEEIDAVEIEKTTNNLHTNLQAGSGPETIRANENDNPAWLYNSAVHALAMYRHLKQLQEDAKVPAPGVYLMTNPKTGHAHTAIVTEDKRVIVPQTGLGTMKDHTYLVRSTETEYVWQPIDLASGAIANG